MFTPRLPASIDEIRIDTLDFWNAPAEQREGAFALLRRERPMSSSKCRSCSPTAHVLVGR